MTPFSFVCICIWPRFKKALAPHAMEQLDLNLGGEKTHQFSKGLQRCAGAVELQGPLHPPP